MTPFEAVRDLRVMRLQISAILFPIGTAILESTASLQGEASALKKLRGNSLRWVRLHLRDEMSHCTDAVLWERENQNDISPSYRVSPSYGTMTTVGNPPCPLRRGREERAQNSESLRFEGVKSRTHENVKFSISDRQYMLGVVGAPLKDRPHTPRNSG
jgi:hypothetical protein